MTLRGSYAKGRAKKAQILDTVLDVVAARGYRGATVKELASAVGLTQNGLLRYFGSKDALFTEILRRRDERSLASVGAKLDSFADEIAEQLIRSVTLDLAIPGLIQLLNRMSNEATDEDHIAHEFFGRRYEAHRNLTARLITQARDKGSVPEGIDAKVIATLIWAAVDGLYTQHFYDANVDVVKHVVCLLEAFGIVPQAAPVRSARRAPQRKTGKPTGHC